MLRPLHSVVETWKPAFAPGEPLAAIGAAWSGIVGERVAENASPSGLMGTTLVVTTRSSAWSNQLQLLAPQILSGLAALPEGRAVERLTFRVGKVQRRWRGSAPRRAAVARRSGETPAPAADAREAFERLRRRVMELRRTAPRACERCGTPQEEGSPALCAPCSGTLEQERLEAVQRILFAAPWLELSEIRAQVEGLERGDYERARRQLLQRWWTTLQRVRYAKRRTSGGSERATASSYILLQSGLAPDRITPAVVRNLLGEELEALLWGSRTDSSK
jgi:Dna[CI] antecedent, DciA